MKEKYFKDFINTHDVEGLVTYNKGRDYIAHDIICLSGKDVYLTYESAQRALKMRCGNRSKEKEIYKCKHCGYYHFHSKSRTKDNEVYKSAYKYNRNKSNKHTKDLFNSYSIDSLEVEKKRREENSHFNLKRFENYQEWRSF